MKKTSYIFNICDEDFSSYISSHGIIRLLKQSTLDDISPNRRFFPVSEKKKYLAIFFPDFAESTFEEEMEEFIRFKEANKTFQGVRHKLFLPVRGQRTHTNANTCKKIRRKGVY